MQNTIEAVEVRRLFATVTGKAFHDLNASGTADSGEGGLSGAAVFVDLNKDGKRQSNEPQATIGSSGSYSLSSSSLIKGKTYTLRLTPPSGYVAAASKSVYLSASSTKASDFSSWKYAKVTIKAFLDANKNFKQDTGESDITTVTYWEDMNNNIRQDSADLVYGPGTVTLNLKPGFHRIQPVGLLAGHRLVTTTAGTFSVTSGQVTTGAAFGYYYPARYGGYVYQDANNNGKYDTGEGVAHRRVWADANSNGRVDPEDYGNYSDANGYYEIPLNPGTFTFRQEQPDGWAGTGGQKVTVKGSSYAIAKGPDFSTAPTGTSTFGKIVGNLFADFNGNGAKDSTEGAYTGDHPYVFFDYDKDGNWDNNESIIVPDYDNGTFTFNDVKPGSYRLAVHPGAGGYPITKYRDITVAAGKTTDAGLFGIQQRFFVYVNTYTDDNRNGHWDPWISDNNGDKISGDDTVTDRTVYIDTNNNGKPDSNEPGVTTDFIFPRGMGFILAPGTYTIRQVVPAGLVETGHDGIGLTASATFRVDSKLHLPSDVPGASAVSSGSDAFLRFLTAPKLSVRAPAAVSYRAASGQGLGQSAWFAKTDDGSKGMLEDVIAS